MPKIIETLSKENGYLYRISAIHCLKGIAKSVSNDVAYEKVIPIIAKHF